MQVNPLHICYIESGYPHAHGGGGAGTYVQLVGRELVRRGHRVSVVTKHCPHCPAVSSDQGVLVYRVSRNDKLHWYASKAPPLRHLAPSIRYLAHGRKIYNAVERIHRRHPIDLAEFTEGGDFWHAFRAPFPYIVHLHGSRYTFLRMAGRAVGRAEWLCRLLELAFIRRAKLVLSPSQALLKLVSDEAAHTFAHTEVLPYPLDPNLLKDDFASSDANAQTVMFAARNDPVKGTATLLEAIPLVHARLPNVSFELYGPELPAWATSDERVRAHPFQSKHQLLEHYRRATLCVVPSYWDNSPNTVYEAMAAGKPVVASAVGGIPELVVDGETGSLVPPRDPYRLAEALTRLMSDEWVLQRMGAQGRNRIKQIADLTANTDRRTVLYQSYAA